MKARIVRAVEAGLLLLVVLLLRAHLADAQTAESTFKAKCVACHGADASGNTAVGKSLHLRDLGSADVQKLTDADLTKIITDGKGAMPSYKDKLSGDQIKGLVGFIRELPKKK
jgi:mono/diheme cytochrome c family protein